MEFTLASCGAPADGEACAAVVWSCDAKALKYAMLQQGFRGNGDIRRASRTIDPLHGAAQHQLVCHRIDICTRNTAGLGQRIAVELPASHQSGVGTRLIFGEAELLQRVRCGRAVFLSSHNSNYYTLRGSSGTR